MSFKNCWDRVKRTTHLKNQSQFAHFLGIGTGSVTDAKRKNTFPEKWAYKIAVEYSLNPKWILTGEGPTRLETGVAEASPAYNEEKVRDEYIYVPQYDVQASAGHGAIAENEVVVDHLAFKRDWVKNKLGADPKALVLITTVGDSMEPAIHEDDLLLINTEVSEVREDGIYCIKNDSTLQIKRIQRMIGGELVVKSDNPAYQSFTVLPEQFGLLEIVGRVVWYGRQI